MITRDLAAALATRGLGWSPVDGDRFFLPDREMDEEVFVVAGMSVEVSELPSGREIRFNGTVEWALDSIGQTEVVWLPREDQLRAALGPRFRRLERLEAGTSGFAVVITGVDDQEQRHVDIDAERAYARALLVVLGG